MVRSSKRKRGKERQLRRQRVESDDGGSSPANNEACNDDQGSAPALPQGMTLLHQWSHEEGHVGIVMHVLSFLDVTKLVEKKQVSRKWKELCTLAIDNKCKNPKNFQTRDELEDTAENYCKKDPSEIEEIATVYGYPINKWRVHLLEDFSLVFRQCYDFNEYIGDWDMSNAKNLNCMFLEAILFNQDLSKWDTSKVTNMSCMFLDARSFNRSLNSWDMSSVTTIKSMFYGAVAFNQPVDSWDTSNIRIMSLAFYHATSFNQSLSNWNLDSVERYSGILENATSYNQELPDGLDAHLAIGSDTDGNSDSDDGAEW